MALRSTNRFTIALSLGCLMCLLQAWLPQRVESQDAGVMPSTDLVVDGRVENVFQSGDEMLVQIMVQRSEAPRLDSAGGVRYPAPGEYVYAHVDAAGFARGIGSQQRVAAPLAGSQVRASLSSGEAGRWEAAGPGWYQELSAVDGGLANRASGGDPGLGIAAEAITVGRQSALKVIRVAPNSPAQQAGVEPGDIVVEANREPVSSQKQLDDAYRASRGPFLLTVRDVRSEREFLVEVDAPAEQLRPDMRVAPPRSLGLTSELAFYSGQPAVKVTNVSPGSPAEQAGVVAGLLILEAGGKSIGGPDELNDAVKNSGKRLELKVVDPKDRRERILQVAL
jgi:membrane-associated protease RseP (regulator of RpoE activity)